MPGAGSEQAAEHHPRPAPMLCDGNVDVDAAYAFAHFGKSLFWQAGELLLAFFLTEAAGLPPSAMGGILALSLVASAVADLALGRVLRGRLSRIEGACSLQFAGACVAAVMLAGLFSTAHLPDAARAPFALATALLFRIAYSLYDLPQNVLLSLATSDGASRLRASSLRIGISGTAALVLALAVAPLLVRDGTPDQPTRFLILSLALAAIALGSAGLLWWTMGRHAHWRVASHVAGTAVAAAREQAGTRPMAVLPLLGMFFVLLLSAPLFNKLEPYFATYVLKSPALGGMLVVAGALGTVLSQPVWCRVIASRDPAQAIAGFAVAVLAGALGWLVMGPWPILAVAWAGVMGIIGGGLGMALWAGYAEAATRQGTLRIGTAYGRLTATSKVALALGALLLGLLLEGLDYRDAHSGHIRWLMALGPAAGAAGCLCLVGLWRLRAGPCREKDDGHPTEYPLKGRSAK